MKRVFIPILFLIGLSVFSIVKPNPEVLEYNEALQIGVDKYLKFLWMIDGAFNNERFKEEFTVNGNKMLDKDKVFTCTYKNKKSKECVGNNFESEFKKLFSKSISYERVYSDQTIYSWISIKNGKYVFKNLDNCHVDRMGISHQIEVVSIKSNEIVYDVLFENKQAKQTNKKDFKLILEDGNWKISSAFYYDLCGMHYIIY